MEDIGWIIMRGAGWILFSVRSAEALLLVLPPLYEESG
jgi:hypothetical protein